MWRGEARPCVSLQCVYFLSVPPPHRRHRARSLPVPRGSMHTGGFRSRLALSGAAGTNITTWRKTRKQNSPQKEKLAKKKHQIHFAALLVKLQVNMTAELCSLFQETHFAWQLLPLFVLIDKKLRQFLRARTSNTSRRANRGGQVILFFFFFFPLNDDQYVVFPTHSRNHPILPPLNTQTRI